MCAAFQYGLVSYGTRPLAEYDASSGGNHKKVARDLLDKLPCNGQRSAFEQGKFIFSTLSETTKLNVVVLSTKETSAATRFFVVDQIKKKFIGRYLSSFSNLGEFSKSAEFGPEIARIFNECASPNANKLALINQNLSDVKDVMTENLAMALQRSEKLEVMEQKAENIKQSADQFQRGATTIRRHMCLQKWKWWFIGGGIILVVIIIIIIIVVVKKKK